MFRNHFISSAVAMVSLTAVGLVASPGAAGTFTTITIDGDFADWAAVPTLLTDAAGDGDPIDIAGVQIANDADNLYLRVAYHTPVNPNVGPSIYLAFDIDRDLATGFNIYGLNIVGSDAGFQNDFPFDQRGGFNSGALTAAATISPVDFLDPGNVFASQEYSISRSVAFASDNVPVFGAGFNLMIWTDSGTAADTTSAISYDFAAPVTSWVKSSSGVWSNAANWSTGTVPNSAATGVALGSAITAPATVTVDGNFTVASLTFNNATNRYTLAPSAPSSSLVVAGAVAVTSGSHTLSVDTKAVALTLTAGTQLSVTGRMAIDYAAGGTSEYAGLVADVLAGRLVGTDGANVRAVGLVEASDLNVTTYGSLTVDASAVLIRSTIGGDTNLDLTVNFTDLVSLAQNYNGTNKQWFDGDFNYDGAVNFSDLVTLAQNYNASVPGALELVQLGGAGFAADWALASALVPEPALLAACEPVKVLALSGWLLKVSSSCCAIRLLLNLLMSRITSASGGDSSARVGARPPGAGPWRTLPPSVPPIACHMPAIAFAAKLAGSGGAIDQLLSPQLAGKRPTSKSRAGSEKSACNPARQSRQSPAASGTDAGNVIPASGGSAWMRATPAAASGTKSSCTAL